MICPNCKGFGSVFAHVNFGDERSGFGEIDCYRCKGSGSIPDEQGEWIVLGCRFRMDRIARGVSLKDEAAKLGVTPAELSAMEHGERPWKTSCPFEISAQSGESRNG